jgi:glycosyltransferase involved in cell wall biosynthesis
MKILQVLNHYLPYQVAGTEVYTHLLSKYLKQSGEIVKVVVPSYKSLQTKGYFYDGVEVICYAEPSKVDRALIMGRRKPDGLVYFENVLKAECPDVVHFHELAGSNGITLHHVESAKRLGFKVIMTFHLAGNSCKSGTLMYKNEMLCDGVIDVEKCTSCMYAVKGLSKGKGKILLPLAKALYKANIDLSSINHTLGTALGFPFIIDQLQNNLIRLSNSCDRFVTLANWYKEVLEKNGINTEKIVPIPQAQPELSKGALIKEYTVSSLPIRLVFIGRISAFKGLDILIAALKELPGEKITLDIYGHDPVDEYSLNCRQQSNKMVNIKWKGKLEPGTVVQALKNYHALCLPSTFSEMSPLVIQEAFAAGIPVIASGVYGNAEQITHNYNGLIFKFKSLEALKNELTRIIEQPMTLKVLADNIEQPMVFGNVGLSYKKLYSELIAA